MVSTPFLPQISTSITGSTVDELVLKGIKHIQQKGKPFTARAGKGLQSYDVNYVLSDSLKRLHLCRHPKSTRYLCREFIAYLNGSLKVNAGLAQASQSWIKIADENGNISSNYGYYVFHQKIPSYENKTQFEWVIDCLRKNLDSRKAFININQAEHKNEKTKDFPCTIGLQFFVRDNYLCSNVFSRSTDIYTGLPYDMGFFSFLTELIYETLKTKLPLSLREELKLGFTCMKTNFTQIYEKTKQQAIALVEGLPSDYEIETDFKMPKINEPRKLLDDIYNKTQKTKFMKWIYDNADY